MRNRYFSLSCDKIGASALVFVYLYVFIYCQPESAANSMASRFHSVTSHHRFELLLFNFMFEGNEH